MIKSQAIALMGNHIANVQWSWHSVHPISGAVVVQCWHHPNWFREVGTKRYTVAAYSLKTRATKKGHLPRYQAVMKGGPLYCLFMYPTRASKAKMDKSREGYLPPGINLDSDHVSEYLLKLDRDDNFTCENGHLWMRVIPGLLRHIDFNRLQTQQLENV